MTSQSRADAILATWRLLRAQGIAPELRLPVIDALCEIERAQLRHVVAIPDRERCRT